MTANPIQTLIPQLPRHAEEEGDFYSVKRASLILSLEQNGCSTETAENLIDLIERLLDTLATLNPDSLQRGEWYFVSYPAQLLALSVLTAMADDKSRFFENGFWNTHSISNDKKERQRDVLKELENRRLQNHGRGQAQPIRYIYVAWSLIKLDDKILLYQREDTRKRHDRQAGDYGLVGGRLNQKDVAGIVDIQSLLTELQSPDSELMKQALPQTLKRELLEETGLVHGTHYEFEHWRNLQPFRQVQGAAPNHALTEYYLSCFNIRLNLDGYLFLRQRLENDECLLAFSLDEVGTRAAQ